jgi:hypothetical protein
MRLTVEGWWRVTRRSCQQKDNGHEGQCQRWTKPGKPKLAKVGSGEGLELVHQLLEAVCAVGGLLI